MKIVLATENKHKLKEFNELLSPVMKLCTASEAGFKGKITEDGKTFEENSYIKASAVSKALNCIAVADDSGLAVDCLNGEPGIYSARYAGEDADDKKNIKKLLENMGDSLCRNAKFVCVITAVFPDGRIITARGECPGVITKECRGEGTFGYDPVFYYPPAGKTFAEMSDEEKNGVSHRGRAFVKFRELFFSEIEKIELES